MSVALWGIVCSVPYNLICIWTVFRMVPMRHPVRLFVLWQLIDIPVYLIPSESSYGWLRTVLTTTLWLAVVLLFAQKRNLRAAVASVMISLLSVVAEVVTTALTMLLLGKYVDNALVTNEPKTMLAVQIAFWNIFALMCWIMIRIWKRSVRSQEEKYLWRFAMVPVSQHFLVMFGGFFSLLRHASAKSYLLLGGMTLCCALADFLLFRALRQYTSQQLAQQRTELLEQQLQQQTEYYDGVVAYIENTARLRHDLRNQLQTAYTLMDRGDYDRASELLTEFAAPLSVEEEVL